MSAPAFGTAGLARREGEVIEVVGGTPGPAGAATIALGDGSVVSIDYAEPERFLDLVADSDRGLDRGTVTELLGEPAADACGDLTRSNADRTIRLRYLRSPGSSLPAPAEADPVACAFVLLADRATDAARPAVECAAAVLDLARLVRRNDLPESLRTIGRRLADTLDHRLAECRDELLDLAGRSGALRDALLDDRERLLPPDLTEAITALRPPPVAAADEEWIDSMFALEAPHRAMAIPSPVLADAVAPLRLVPPMRPHIAAIDRGVWIIACAPPDEPKAKQERWVRILDSALATVAVAPVIDSPRGSTAEVLVPEHLVPDNVEIEITETPFPIVPEGLGAIAAAVRAGRAAADLERADRPDRASRAWRDCARLWADLGDAERARAAQRFATRIGLGDRRGRDLGDRSLVTDLVARAIAD